MPPRGKTPDLFPSLSLGAACRPEGQRGPVHFSMTHSTNHLSLVRCTFQLTHYAPAHFSGAWQGGVGLAILGEYGAGNLSFCVFGVDCVDRGGADGVPAVACAIGGGVDGDGDRDRADWSGRAGVDRGADGVVGGWVGAVSGGERVGFFGAGVFDGAGGGGDESAAVGE